MKAAVVLALFALVATAVAAPLTEQQYEFLFTRYVDQYSKQYEIDQFFSRYNTFKNNLNAILAHNSKVGRSYTLAMNEFGDMTNEEFRKKMTGLRPTINTFLQAQNVESLSHIQASDSVDWRQKNAVTPVKNQGQCGSCWAFSATGAIEGAWAIKKGKLVSVSEQQLVDCAGSTGNSGCNGGLMDLAFQWVSKNGGLCTETDYPYTAVDGNCKKSCSPSVTVSSYKNVAAKDEAELLKAVNIGPVAIAIEADEMGFQFYSGGVFDGSCGTNLDHGVLIVGYGTDAGKDYWIVKNSWGASWGESGYIRLVRNKNQCGLAIQPVYPIV